MKTTMFGAGLLVFVTLASTSALTAAENASASDPVNIFTAPATNRTIVTTLQSGRVYAFVSALSGKCLDIRDHSYSSGGQLQQWDCTTNTNQKFRAIGNAKTGLTLAAIESRLCVETDKKNNDNGNKIVQRLDCDPTKRTFKVLYSHADKMKIVRTVNGVDKCVDIEGPSSENGALLHLWDCNGGYSQSFRVYEQAPTESPL